MNNNSIKSDPMLWAKIVKNIKSKKTHGTLAGQWSARKAQAAVKAYKVAGGEYIGGNKSQTSLKKWILFLIFLFDATPPAITNVLCLILFLFLNSLNANLLFEYNISSIVF